MRYLNVLISYLFMVIGFLAARAYGDMDFIGIVILGLIAHLVYFGLLAMFEKR